uniref:Uncharacterized protein n=1 Tax=Anguilla anguilla TaxID=7936 RepID=A0A0E9XA18_ANGAN
MGHARCQDLPTVPQCCGIHTSAQVLPGLLKVGMAKPSPSEAA